MNLSERVYPVVQPLLKRLRRSRWVIHRLFDVSIPTDVLVQFDPVTVLLARVIPELIPELVHKHSVPSDDPEPLNILETGIGEGALVTLSIAKWNQRGGTRSMNLRFSGVDCSPGRVQSSRRVSRSNGIEADFWVSDLFSEVTEASFDLVFFNPPYVPTQTGKRLRLTERLGVDGDQMWDGGEDGTAVLAKFLRDAPKVLRPDSRIVFGVQPIFVDDCRARQAIHDAGLALDATHARACIPAMVYVIKTPRK